VPAHLTDSTLEKDPGVKEARLFGIKDIRLAEADTPRPAEGESLIRVESVGLCGSDLHWYSNGGIGQARLTAPLVLGHEFAGTVEGGLLDGRRIAVDPAIPCRACRQCWEGNGNLCPTTLFAGHETHDGGLREYVTWPTRLLHPIPSALTIEAAAMLEPLGVALHAFDRARVRLGSRIAVVGCGPIGLMLVQLARTAGCPTIVAVEPLSHRRAVAKEFGANLVLNPTDNLSVLLDAVGVGVDAAFEVAGNDDAVDLAMRLARPGGRVLITGIPSNDSTTFETSVARKKGLTISLIQRMNDVFTRTISLVEQGFVDLDSMVSNRFTLDHTADAFAIAAARTGVKVIVVK
jgi:L-iditol 2-dehydrogenase